MKHLKTFENNYNFDKYLIVRASNELGYLLLEITNIEQDFVFFNTLFKLYKDEIIPMENKSNLSNLRDKFLNKKILYQSNKYSDAMDYLKMLKNTNKFNL